MWNELVKIKANEFNLARNSENKYYSIVDDNNDIILDKNVIKWFNNGFILCVYHEWGCEERGDHQHIWDYYIFSILNNKLDEIYSIKTNDENYYTNLDDFKYECLPILGPQFGTYYGAIDKTGSIIIKFSYSLDEVIIRILIRSYFSGLIKDKSIREEVVAILIMAENQVQNTSVIDDFIMNLLNSFHDIYEVLFHLILFRDLYNQNKPNERNRHFGDELAYFQNRFDIYFIIELIKDKMGINKNLFLLYNYARDLKSNYFENLILDYLALDPEHWGGQKCIEDRKRHLIQLCNILPFVKFESSTFDIIAKRNMQKISTSSPFVSGRKVVVEEYLTVQSNYTQKKYVGNRFFCIYKQPADFLDHQKNKDLHIVSDITKSDVYFIAEGKSIQLCLFDFMCTYNDYLEFLK